MPRFMDVHTGMKGLSQDDLHREHEKDKQIEGDERVRFIKSWADPSAGRVFCLSEGPSKEAVQRVHERAGHRADEIYEIQYEVE